MSRRGDSETGKPSSGYWAPGVHLTTIGDYGVNCPVCTCYNDPDYLFSKLKNEPFKRIKCKGCKRPMNCTVQLDGSFVLSEIVEKSEGIETEK